jgi:hypothetical protein
VAPQRLRELRDVGIERGLIDEGRFEIEPEAAVESGFHLEMALARPGQIQKRGHRRTMVTQSVLGASPTFLNARSGPP